jgi:hypothetical protein
MGVNVKVVNTSEDENDVIIVAVQTKGAGEHVESVLKSKESAHFEVHGNQNLHVREALKG